MIKGAILPLFYLPSIEYFNKLKTYKQNLLIEQFEHFPKQTYRNRATILSPNGKLDLIIPVLKGSKVHTCIKDVKMSCDFNWQRLHWMSLQTSYRRSSYFEFYEDELAPFYEKKWVFLFDYNQELLQVILNFLKLPADYSLTESYLRNYEELEDLRNAMSPKQHSSFKSVPYYQVFQERHGFLPNLSILDLLFSQGPQSSAYL